VLFFRLLSKLVRAILAAQHHKLNGGITVAKNKMKEWLLKARKEEALKLAKLAGTSLGVLRQIGGGYRTEGRASTTPETARALELAAKKLPHLPELPRGELCQACGKCEYYKGAKK